MKWVYASTHKDFFDQFFKTSYFPRHDTFNRLFGALDMVEFEQWFRKKAQAVVDFVSTHNPNPSVFNHIAIDGKTIRNSGFTKPYHIVTAWLATNKIALGQVKVDEKSNEITAIPELIAALDLEKTVVTYDAMGCQRQICNDIIAKGGHYIIAVKDNQPILFENVIAQIEETFEKGHSQTFATNKGHGRHEKRWCLVMNADKESYDFRDWPGIKSILGMQLTPMTTRYSILSHESVSCQHDGFYRHVPHRGGLLGVSKHGEVVQWLQLLALRQPVALEKSTWFILLPRVWPIVGLIGIT